MRVGVVLITVLMISCGSDTSVGSGEVIEVLPSFTFDDYELVPSGGFVVADDRAAALAKVEELFGGALPTGVEEALATDDFDRSFVVTDTVDPCKSSTLFITDDSQHFGGLPGEPDSVCDAVASQWVFYEVDHAYREVFS